MSMKSRARWASAGQKLGIAASGSLALAWIAAPADAQTFRTASAVDPWNALSFGAGIGHDFFHVPVSVSSYDSWAGANDFSADLHGNGFDQTVEIGKDFRMGSTVWGLYADFTHADKGDAVKRSECYYWCLNTRATVQLGDSVSLVARVGQLMDPATLLYGLGGFTLQHYRAAARAYSEYYDSTASDGSTGVLTGLVVGFGAEKLITPHLSIKGEYRFVHFGSPGSFSDSTCCTTSVDAKFGNITDQVFRVVLSFKAL
jgi:opacity protein-like surface antigen